jgi:hypothetical protein
MRRRERGLTRSPASGAFLLLVTLLLASPALGQFDSGSTGENGSFPPIAIPEGTTEITIALAAVGGGDNVAFSGGSEPLATARLPATPADGFADGVLRFSSFELPADVTLRFSPHPANPPVTILCQGDVVVRGTISLNGENGGGAGTGGGGAPGPGGFRGGSGGTTTASGGAGLGPGGGAPGTVLGATGGGAGFALAGTLAESDDGSRCPQCGAPYGTNFLRPLIGGSGGGGGYISSGGSVPGATGGGGGGAIAVASSTRILVEGRIEARGGNAGINGSGGGGGGGGSGGAIRLTAPILEGTNQSLDTSRGEGAPRVNGPFGGAGSRGRIRLESFRSSLPCPITGVCTVGVPGPVLAASLATLVIESVEGEAVTSTPSGSLGGVDVAVPAPGSIAVGLRATGLLPGRTITLLVKPENGTPFTVTSPGLVGTTEDSSISVNVDLPGSGTYFLEATASVGS